MNTNGRYGSKGALPRNDACAAKKPAPTYTLRGGSGAAASGGPLTGPLPRRMMPSSTTDAENVAAQSLPVPFVLRFQLPDSEKPGGYALMTTLG